MTSLCWTWSVLLVSTTCTLGIILVMGSASERRCYVEMTCLIGCDCTRMMPVHYHEVTNERHKNQYWPVKSHINAPIVFQLVCCYNISYFEWYNRAFSLTVGDISCTFELSSCGWTNDPKAPYKWTRNSGNTPSPNTGPSTDRNGSKTWRKMGQVTELWLSWYLVLLSTDSKTRQQDSRSFVTRPKYVCMYAY